MAENATASVFFCRSSGSARSSRRNRRERRSRWLFSPAWAKRKLCKTVIRLLHSTAPMNTNWMGHRASARFMGRMSSTSTRRV